eukprot:275129_1
MAFFDDNKVTIALWILSMVANCIFGLTIIYFYLKRSCGKNKQKVIQRVETSLNLWGIRISILFVLISIIISSMWPQYFTFYGEWKHAHWDIFDGMNANKARTYTYIIMSFGITLMFIGDILLIWTLYNLGRMWTMLVATVENAELITTGPYQLARHPMYTSIIIFWIGYLLGIGQWLTWICGDVAFIFAITRIRNEERVLIKQFGQEYIDYMNTRGAFCCYTFCDCGIGAQERQVTLLSQTN